jgi:hypothetical protein
MGREFRGIRSGMCRAFPIVPALRRLPMSSRRRSLALAVLVLAWLTAVGVGLTVLWGYENAPGLAATPPTSWPGASRIALAADRTTLVMLVHPRCPCSRASLEELDRVMARASDRVAASIVFVTPSGAAHAWTDTDLWRQASAIRGVTVVRDEGGVEARRFQAWTSGETLLYAADGHLLFAGGITGSRGHEGDNAGQQAVLASLLAHAAVQSAPVFGCALGTSATRRPSAPEHG